MQLQHFLLAFALAAGVTAQLEDLETTKDFHLYITESSNSTLVGWSIFACHVGPMSRVLCVTDDGIFERASAFTHQYKAMDEDEGEEGEDKHAIGPLLSKAYYTEKAELKFLESMMVMGTQLWSDLAIPSLQINDEDYSPVGFDDDDNMYLAAYGDGSHEAPADKVSPWDPSHAMYNWYACRETHVNSYTYHAINWALVPPPNEPGCDSVTIHRVYE